MTREISLYGIKGLIPESENFRWSEIGQRWFVGFRFSPDIGVGMLCDRGGCHEAVAAAACNWHAQRLGKCDMRPGIDGLAALAQQTEKKHGN